MRTSLLLMALMTGVCLSPISVMAQNVDIGKPIPSELAASDQKGKMHNFSDLTGKNGLVLVFVRSAEWSQPCQNQIADFSAKRKQFEKQGYPVVVVSYDPADKLRAFADARQIDLPLLSDPRSDIIRSFGILNTEVVKGTMAYGTPKPGVYVVGQDKLVKAKFFKDNLLERVSAAEVLKSVSVEEKKVEDNRVFDIDPDAKNAPPSDMNPMETLDPVAPVVPADPVAPDAPVSSDSPDIMPPAVEPPLAPDAAIAPNLGVPAIVGPGLPVPEPVVPAVEAPAMPAEPAVVPDMPAQPDVAPNPPVDAIKKTVPSEPQPPVSEKLPVSPAL